MTRKVLLSRWVEKLDPSVDPAYPVSQLEAAIDSAISKLPTDPVNACQSQAGTGITLAEGISNNLQVLVEELPNTARAIASNLLSR